jgi:two-component system nitrogen regulation response regulator GlnG
MQRKLLIIENDSDALNLLQRLFTDDGVALFPEKDVRSALACVRKEHPNVALIDMTDEGQSGLATMMAIKQQDPRVCVIMMSGRLTTQDAIESMKHGAYDYLGKPLDMNQLKSVVERALQNSLLSREVRMVGAVVPEAADEDDRDVLIGSSPEIVEIWKMVGMISQSDATVLIQGESGTGKELIARSVYNNSQRKNKPFLIVNCAALPENLLESELFGHEKGAFTDASVRRIGRFEQSAGGTIFLDEIAEMSLKSQAKLLRVLENKEFSRVGGTETIKADVRIIAATNRSLIAAVKEKSFRMDLFYRIKVMTIHLPPLRDRREDIPLLADFFVKRTCREVHKPPMLISPAALKLLQAHSWEGNIRELSNVMKSAVVFSKSDSLQPEDVTPLLDIGRAGDAEPSTAVSGSSSIQFHSLFEAVAGSHEGAAYKMFISEAEKALLSLTMSKYKNNEVHASKFLGISRNTLRQRLKLYNLK